MMTKAQAAKYLGVEPADIAVLEIEESTDYCDTYRARLARSVKEFGRRGDNVLFPVEKNVSRGA